MGVKKSNNDLFLVQSNKLVEAHYRLSLQEKRLILWLIKSIDPQDTDFKKYHLKISDFAEMTGLTIKTQYNEMRKVTKALISRPIEIENSETNAIMQIAWLCCALWEPRKGICTLEFHPALKPYLLQLKTHFTKISFADLLGLKSVYSIRIFELLVQYEYIGKRTMNIEEIRSWCGIEKGEYKSYAHLKSRLIEKAKTEINEKTEYEVDYEEIKESRKVIALEWIIKKKTFFEKSQLEKAEKISKELRSQNALIEKIIEYGFSRPTAKKIIQEAGEEVITNALRAVDIQVERGHVRNPKAMLKTAVQEKWHPEIYKANKSKS